MIEQGFPQVYIEHTLGWSFMKIQFQNDAIKLVLILQRYLQCLYTQIIAVSMGLYKLEKWWWSILDEKNIQT